MKILVIIMVAFICLGGAANLWYINKPRKPTTAGGVLFIILFNTMTAWLLVRAYL